MHPATPSAQTPDVSASSGIGHLIDALLTAALSAPDCSPLQHAAASAAARLAGAGYWTPPAAHEAATAQAFLRDIDALLNDPQTKNRQRLRDAAADFHRLIDKALVQAQSDASQSVTAA